MGGGFNDHVTQPPMLILQLMEDGALARVRMRLDHFGPCHVSTLPSVGTMRPEVVRDFFATALLGLALLFSVAVDDVPSLTEERPSLTKRRRLDPLNGQGVGVTDACRHASSPSPRALRVSGFCLIVKKIQAKRRDTKALNSLVGLVFVRVFPHLAEPAGEHLGD
jgi:hypothetical protein